MGPLKEEEHPVPRCSCDPIVYITLAASLVSRNVSNKRPPELLKTCVTAISTPIDDGQYGQIDHLDKPKRM